MGVTDRPLKIPINQPKPVRTFNSFLRTVLSSFLAFVLAWRILFFKKLEKQAENENSDPEMAQPGPSSVLSLLSTDVIPESSSSGEDRPPPPPPALLQPSIPAYLDTINEEESDDLRSISSASFASPRTFIDRSDISSDAINRSVSSRLSDSDYKSPEARSPQQVRKSPEGKATSSCDTSLESNEVTIIERETEEQHPEKSESQSEPGFSQGLLKELAKLGQDTQSKSKEDGSYSSSSERSIISQVAREMAEQGDEIEIPKNESKDADRDQEEELVYNEERRKTMTMEDSLSLDSISINLDATKDSILNQSVTSNPIDEAQEMDKTIRLERPSARPPSPPLDLPPPPPDLQSPKQLPPPPPPPKENSPVRAAPPPPSILNQTPVIQRTKELAEIPFKAPPPPPPLPSDSRDTRNMFSAYDRSDQGMSSPPNEAPPPPPHTGSGSKSGFSSREDLLSEHPPSRSTIREIPVQRAPSAAYSQSTVMDYRMPSSYAAPSNDGQDEYYRKEVISRTIITRSTEALSQPPLGRSSPIEREKYITYPDSNTREERTVDYRTTYSRDVEEEERRIREDQEKRRQEEADRRRREEESRRQWELREQEMLDRLRRERELKEREVERNITERERAEKERIERDRLDRERLEMQRRAEWERMENERRGLEEADLARKRQLEKERLAMERLEEERREKERLERERERLERERLEAERREAERLEKIRIERERIERERIEIERIERIKRERIEKERREKEKEREEQERLLREREELERIERERRQLELEERELIERTRREAEDRERQRLEDEAREARRREEERREAELLGDIQRQAEERERLRRLQEREEQERLERIRREQQRIEQEKADADRRERERLEEERREKELLEAQRRAKEQREKERLDDIERERLRLEEERKERERRETERRAAQERERQRRAEEEAERLRLLDIQRAANAREAQRKAELERDRDREELEREARKIAEMERRENERRERERLEEERSLAELREKERRNQEIRDRERAEAAEREAARRLDDRRSRDKLDIIVRERSERERFEAEKRRLLAEKEAMNKKKQALTSSEALAKLTRPPYFSRDNLNTEVTTKVERQVIERVDRNVWVDDYRYPSSTQNALQYSLDSTNDENIRDRLYNPHDLGRSGSTRSKQYRDRAQLQKARRDFFTSAPESTDATSDRFHRSTDEVSARGRPEYRGPLLQKFHDGEFKSKTELDHLPYSRVGPSEYGKVEETNMDEVHRRSGSVVDYNRTSRRDVVESAATVTDSHTRSRSADYLMDRRLREETEPPENQLQKTMGEISPRNSRVSEHELRFRKSTEKLTVPDWYRENRPTIRPTDVDSTLPRQYQQPADNFSRPYSQQQYGQPYSYTQPARTGIDLPRGMFDRYKDEIDEMKRSRTSLHHIGQEPRQEQRPSPMPRRSLSQEVISSGQYMETTSSRALPGYTVSEVPGSWKENRTRASRVVEVADTFVEPKQVVDQYGNVSVRYGGRVTIEEVLDSIFQQTAPVSTTPADSSYPLADNLYQGNTDGPGIYTKNYSLMDKVVKQPEMAESLLRSEMLFVRCAHCHRTRELAQARYQFVSCKHCYTYYCSRECRLNDWQQHSGRCSFARINTLCKDVIMKVREDQMAQACMSRIARDGFAHNGRGSVNIRLGSPQIAQAYVTNGWQALSHIPQPELLYYYTVAALIQEKKEPSLVALCRRYDPKEKFILSVSIIADIEHCPQTPPPETVDWPRPQSRAPTAQDYGGSPAYKPYAPEYNRVQPHYNPYSPITLVPTDV